MTERLIVLVTGATGFVGSHLCTRMVDDGYEVRALVRPGSQRLDQLDHFQVAPVRADIRDPDAVEAACAEVDIVIHLVGLIRETRHNSFATTVAEGTQHLVAAAHRAGVKRFLYMSAVGADLNGPTLYFRTKAEAEAVVQVSGMQWLIFRPSIIFGPRDGFVATIRQITRLPLAVPIIGHGRFRFQPIYIDDLTEIISRALHKPEVWNRIYAVGGPEPLGFEAMVDEVMRIEGRRKPKLHLPLWYMRIVASLPLAPITHDQLTMLLQESYCDIQPMVEAFRVQPRTFRDGLEAYLRNGS